MTGLCLTVPVVTESEVTAHRLHNDTTYSVVYSCSKRSGQNKSEMNFNMMKTFNPINTKAERHTKR